jgi:hypothetical protein
MNRIWRAIIACASTSLLGTIARRQTTMTSPPEIAKRQIPSHRVNIPELKSALDPRLRSATPT